MESPTPTAVIVHAINLRPGDVLVDWDESYIVEQMSYANPHFAPPLRVTFAGGEVWFPPRFQPVWVEPRT